MTTVLIAAGCQLRQTAPPDHTLPHTAGTETESAILLVNGLDCDSCAKDIDTVLRTVAGIDQVFVYPTDGLVEVTFKENHHPTRERLQQAVKQGGFTYVDLVTR